MKPLLILLMLACATAASAQLLHGVTDSLSGGGTPTPPAGCTGAIDLSEGCPQPMLGL